MPYQIKFRIHSDESYGEEQMKHGMYKIMDELKAAKLRPILAACLVALGAAICAWVTR